jgi:heptosyltransferase III
VKFLLLKLNHLGDTLLLSPTIDFLHQKFPGARIDVVVRSGCEAMLRGHPAITNLVPVARPEKRQRSFADGWKQFSKAWGTIGFEGYDYGFDLSHSDRAKFWLIAGGAKQRGINDAYGVVKGWKRNLFNQFSHFEWAKEHQVLRDFRTVADVVDPTARPGPLSFHPQVEEAALFSKLPFLRDLGPFAILHPTSRWSFKEWVPERWAQVIDEIEVRHGLKVLLSTGPDAREHGYIHQILAATKTKPLWNEGKTDLHELGWMLARARLFLGVDTVAMHLAAAMQTPIVGLFGPSSEWSWHPWQVRHELVLGPCPCKQARQFTCDKSKIFPCLESISPESVLTAADKLLAR